MQYMLAIAVLSAALLWLPVSAQVPVIVWPFTGQGHWPTDSLGKALVTVDLHLDRLLAINQDAQSWRAVHRVHLSWVDPRAQDEVLAATSSWYNDSSSTCSMPCDASMSFEAGCCSSLWLPQIDLPNLLEYNYQANPPRWRIWVEPVVLSNGTRSSMVHWTVRLDGTWFSPFDFRAWPLEHQHLVVEMQPSPVLASKMALVLGNLGQLGNTPHTKGVDLAGWWINKVTPRMYDTSACFKRSNTTSWVFGLDGSGSSSMVQLQSLGPGDVTTFLSNATVVTTIEEDACGNIGNFEGVSQYGSYVLVIDTMVVRDKTFYILVFIVPLIIVTLMVFVIYAMERHNLEARMGVIVTLVLALSALQFMYNFPPASYLNVVQQLTLTSYVLFALVSIECIITSSIARIHERKRAHNAALLAAGLKTLTSMRTSMDLDRSSAGYTDSSFDAYSRDRSAAPSGLFFGSLPSRNSDPAPLRPPGLPPPGLVTRRSGAADCEAPALPNMPSIPEVDARSSNCLSGASAAEGPPQQQQQQQQQQQVLSPFLPPTEVIRVHSSGGSGQPVGESVEWPTWSKMFPRRSSEGGGDPLQPRGRLQALPPRIVAGPVGQQSRLRKGMGNATKSVAQLWGNLQERSVAVHSKMSMDEAYAQLLARRVDMVCSCALLISYVTVIATLLAVSSSVGDHKLMLAGSTAPGNM